MTIPLVEIRDLCVTLGGVRILHHVNADLERGRITALIGLNGSGKTTLLRALLKEVPYSGSIKFNCGHDHRRQTPEHVGYVPQKLRTDANLPLTVRDLLALALQRRPLFLGVSRAVKGVMIGLLERVGIRDPRAMLDRPVDKLSGGELQRVLMGLALHPDPEMLLLDEPAAGIDFKDQEGFYELIGRLNTQTGVTILLVSHEMAVVSRYADHVLCLKDGHIQCQGSPRDIPLKQMVEETFGLDKGLYDHHHHPSDERLRARD
jgi:zinc transport system ATP-binding protein